MYFFIAAFLWGSVSLASAPHCVATFGELDVVKQEVNSTEEYYFCFGYHHGQDRAWMMDYFRRSAQGKNAEILGMDHLKTDLMMRLLDLSGLAARIWSQFPADEKAKLEAYARGVNEGFKTGKDAHEFRDLSYAPEEWHPVNTIEVLLLQSFDQTRKTFVTDWEQEKFKARWKDEAAKLMDNDDPPWENTILKKGEYPTREKITSRTRAPEKKLPALWSPFPEIFGRESGSNNWVVSAKKSQSGVAMLANDPHLDLKTPLFWYWMHLKSPEHEVIGASLPGVPLVASGTNGKVAWGLTNSYINTADAAFIKDIPDSEIISIRPLVWIKVWKISVPFFFKSFEKTKSGNPVLPLELETKDRIFLRWTGFQLKASDIIPMFSLPDVKNVSEMDMKLRDVGLPSWNFVFADTEGEIGYRLIGNSYRALGTTPYGMKTMTFEEFKSHEIFTPDERPHVLKPARGYVYSANNRHWPSDSAFSGGRGYAYSFRGNRIDELLQPKQDVESFKKIQCDHQAVDAKYFVPRILSAIEIPELKDWDYQAVETSKAAPVFRRFTDLLMAKWDVNEYGLYRLLGNVTDQMKKEMKAVYQSALKDTHGRSWGEFHFLGFEHLSKNADWKFSPEIPAAGDNHTVDPGTSRWNEDRKVYEHSSGASMRMIIEMEKRPKIHLVLPGFNRDYTTETKMNPWEDWKQCRYTTISF